MPVMKRALLCLFALSFIFSGCATTDREEEVSPLAKLYDEARALVANDDRPGAILLLDAAMGDEAFAEVKPSIFNAILSLLMESGRHEAACARHLTMASESAALAESAYPIMEQHLVRADKNALLLDWSTQMLAIPFSDRIKARAFILNAYALTVNDREKEALDLIPSCRSTLGTPMCETIYSGIINMFVSIKKYDAAEVAISKVEASAGNDPELLKLANMARLELLSVQGKWNAFVALYKTKLASLSDSGASRILHQTASRMSQAKKLDLAESICVFTIDTRKPDERCVLTATQYWTKIIRENRPEAIPTQFRKLLDKKIPAERIASMTRQSFYVVLNTEKPEPIKQMLKIVKELRAQLTKDDDLESAQTMLLDGSFILNDYDTAIAMLKEGIKGKDDAWHQIAIVKLKAHKALDAGQTEDAVKHFRKFMDLIKSMDNEVDPSTGMTFTANWCLARNAKRIGDIYAKAGNEKKAAAAYKEAEVHFENTLADFKEGSKELVSVKDEMKLLPASE
jgi:tetratricopeptide (TPR) repeat protein